MKPKLFLALMVVVLALLGWYILRGNSPEKQAIAAYDKLVAAFEARSVLRLRMQLPEDFRVDGLGGIDESLAACQYFFQQVRSVDVSSRVRVAQSRPDAIELSVRAQLSGVHSDGGRFSGLSDEFSDLAFTLVVTRKDHRWVPSRLIPDQALRKEMRSFSGT